MSTTQRILVGFSAVLVLLLVVAQTNAQMPPVNGPNHEHLLPVEWHVGHWVHRGRTEDGRPLFVRRSAEWALDGNYLTAVTIFRVEGRPEMVWRHMIGWDSIHNQVNSWVFSSDGRFMHGVWTMVTPHRSVGELRGVTPAGERTVATVTYTRLGDDAYLYEVTDHTVDGQPRPDISWRFHRVMSPD